MDVSERIIFSEDIGYKSKWLLIILIELSQKLTNEKTDFFFRSQEDLIFDTGMNGHTVRKCRQELVDKKFIKSWMGHRIDSRTNRKHPIMFYQILK